MENNKNNFVGNLTHWFRSSITLKLITIVMLALLLLIPMSMISSLIHERQERQEQVKNDITSTWSRNQKLIGPVLSVPLVEKNVEEDKEPEVKNFIILPQILEIRGNIDTQHLHRNIYEVVVFNSQISMKGTFEDVESLLQKEYPTFKPDWNKAAITCQVSDLRGLQEIPELYWSNQTIPAAPGSKIKAIQQGILFDLNASDALPIRGTKEFSLNLKLKGSDNLSFCPTGKETRVKMASSWPDPGFTGAFLPNERSIHDKGFNAEWKVLEMNRNFPQGWEEGSISEPFENAMFGVSLVKPIDEYQKSVRSAKYGLMTISLIFLVCFLVEILTGQKIHTFQYTLVGLAICLFYTLLIALSEHLAFNGAYLISSSIIIGMIGFYSKSIFNKRKPSLVLCGILILIFGFIFTTLQMEGYALVIGASGLTAILAITMYVTRKIDWYQLSRSG